MKERVRAFYKSLPLKNQVAYVNSLEPAIIEINDDITGLNNMDILHITG